MLLLGWSDLNGPRRIGMVIALRGGEVGNLKIEVDCGRRIHGEVRRDVVVNPSTIVCLYRSASIPLHSNFLPQRRN
jgi:hypothetical protein